MYGVENTLMQKMQMRLREKIYKEMLEQQAKYKKQKFESASYGRYKTQANQPQRNPPKNISSSYNFQQTTKGLDHFSTFLPLISNKSKSRYTTQEDQQPHNYSKQYLKYLKKREKPQPSKPSNYKLSNQQPEYDESNDKYEKQTIPYMNALPEESDDQRTQLYLQQCEQIISSLKQLTIRNSKKVKPKPSKYQPQQTFFQRKAPSRSFRIQQQNKIKPKPFTPNHYSFSQPYSPILTSPNQFITTNQFSRLSKPQQNKFSRLIATQKSGKTQFNEFIDRDQNKKMKVHQNVRQNHRSLSPLRQQRENDIETNKETSKNNQSKVSTKDEDQQKPQKKEKTSKLNQQKSSEKNKKQKASEKEGQSARKKQSAIIKYLKKARACGSLLYQKIESRKKNGEEGEEQEQNQQPAA